MDEIWRDIPGYEGRYQASNLGRVRSLDRVVRSKTRHGKWFDRPIKGKNLNFSNKINGAGYYCVAIGIKRSEMVHRMVAMAFCSGYKTGLTVNHIDCNKLNNKAENLDWVSYKDNSKHAFKNGLYDKVIETQKKRWSKSGNPRSKLSNQQRSQVLQLIKAGFQNKQIAKLYKVKPESISWLKVNVLKIKEPRSATLRRSRQLPYLTRAVRDDLFRKRKHKR